MQNTCRCAVLWYQTCKPQKDYAPVELCSHFLFLGRVRDFRIDPTRARVLSESIEIAQICLPPNRDDAGEERPVLERDKSEREGCHSRPNLAAIDIADGHRSLDPLPDRTEVLAREGGLHPEEICVEDGREAHLVDNNLGR